MKIAIIGAGFTGLAAAWDLVKDGHEVTVYEATDYPGGLAAGFKEKDWDWSLEHHYHHIFSSDTDIIGWAKELGLNNLIEFYDVKTSMRYNGQQFRLDSPLSLLQAPVLSPIDKIRAGATLAALKIGSRWRGLEKLTAEQFLIRYMGQPAYQILWQPLLVGKFGHYSSKVNAAWFWARINARTKQLGYFSGGFANFAAQVVDRLKGVGVKFQFSRPVSQIKIMHKQLAVVTPSSTQRFDKVLVASSSHILSKLVTNFPQTYQTKLNRLQGLAAITLVLELDQPFFNDHTYWLNINEKDWPFLAAVEHTNLAKSKNYGGKHLLYVGKYLDSATQQYQLSAQQLLKLYLPYLEQLSPGFAKTISGKWLFKTAFAQPVVGINHSHLVPALKTPIDNLYWASMQHIYPWDRGTNFAVQIGRQAAKLILDPDDQA